HVCNICGSVIFVERGCNKVSVDVTYSGHDVLAESHRQFVF
ncbi:ADP-ribosylglycohydrolase, partial [Alteromonadaceae bacterium A_SAG8]|nr:ADP-ribosylglycohydrolase [Alteromonadaceae bacterium A_SAG8]